MKWGTLEQYRWTRPADFQHNTAFPVKVVAVIGWSSDGSAAQADWAAYRGPSDWPDDRVAREGDKLSKRAAEALFPSLAAGCAYYRE